MFFKLSFNKHFRAIMDITNEAIKITIGECLKKQNVLVPDVLSDLITKYIPNNCDCYDEQEPYNITYDSDGEINEDEYLCMEEVDKVLASEAVKNADVYYSPSYSLGNKDKPTFIIPNDIDTIVWHHVERNGISDDIWFVELDTIIIVKLKNKAFCLIKFLKGLDGCSCYQDEVEECDIHVAPTWEDLIDKCMDAKMRWRVFNDDAS